MAEKENGDAAAVMVVVPPNEVRYRGVRKRSRGKYRAVITNQKGRVWLGTFNTPEQAARAYDTAEKMYHGHKAKLNYPPSNEDNLENPNKNVSGNYIQKTTNDEHLHHELNLDLTLAPPGSM